MTAMARMRAAASTSVESAQVFLRDVGAGLLDVCHNSLALLGLCVVGVTLFAGSHEELRTEFEAHALGWLLARQEAREPAVTAADAVVETEPDAVTRATAADPKTLPRQQAAVAQWLSRRYKVAPEPVSRLVQEAWAVGHRMGLGEMDLARMPVVGA